MNWYRLKEAVASAIGLPHDLLHVIFGIIIYVAAALLSGNTRHSPIYGLAAVFSLQIINELLDAYVPSIMRFRVGWPEALWDTLLTVSIPIALTFWSLRRRRRSGK